MIYTTLIGVTCLVFPGLVDPFLSGKAIFFFWSVGIWLGLEFIRGTSIAAPAGKLLWFWGLALALSLTRATDPLSSFQLWALGLAAFIFCGAHHELSESKLRRLVVGLGVFQVIVGSLQLLLLSDPAAYSDFPQRLKFAGTLGNPQYVATFLGMGFCLLFAERQKTFRHWIGLGVLATGLLLARVQGTVLCLLLTCFILTPLSLRQRVLGLLAFVFGVIALESLLHWHTLRGRLLLDVSALRVLWNSGGIGIGLGQFGNHLLVAQREVFSIPLLAPLKANAAFSDHPHNEYLALLCELGVAAVIPFFFIRRLLKKLSPILLFILLEGFLSFPWRILPIVLVVGLTLNRGQSSGAIWRGPKLALLSALFLFIGAVTFAGQWSERRADVLARSGHIPAAERYVDVGLRFNPRSPSLLLLKGRLRYFRFDCEAALYYARLANSYGERIDSLKLEGLALFSLHQWEAAEKLYLRLAETLPNQITAHFYLGEIYLRTHRPAEAAREFSLLPSHKPKNAKATLDQWRARDWL